MLTFAIPWAFLLLPLPWLLRWALPPRETTQVSVRVPFGQRLEQALAGMQGQPRGRGDRLALLSRVCVWGLLVTALARPQWIEPPVTRTLPTRDLLLLVDLSASMDQKDFNNAQGQKVDRLTAVKEVVGEFLLRRKGDRVGLVVFGDAPYLQAPFSVDLELSRQLLEECEVGMAGPKTALGDAIGLGIKQFENSDAPAKTMIALTDGNDTKSQLPPVEAARVAAEREIDIYTVAIGDPTTAGEDKLDEQALKDVAAAAHGSYFFAADRAQLESIYEKLDQIETSEIKTVSHRPRHDLYYIFVLAALILSAVTHLRELLRNSAHSSAMPAAGRLQVNPYNGRLEVES